MPKWGLTPKQRQSKPWGLPSEELAPAKTITDPVHGDIYITRIEKRVIDSVPMQRLRRVRQLGTTHVVYPGATHTRFSHSLGALRSAQDLLDAVVDHRNGPHRVSDHFDEWESDPETYELRVAEATVLARLGALLHDMTHVPFGHSIEDDVGILVPHDENTGRFEGLWAQFDDELKMLLGGELEKELRPLILSKEKRSETEARVSRYPFVADIVGNTICADLLDYLKRDHMYTGLPAGLGHRFIDGFYVTRSDNPYYPARMAMQIARNGRPRADVVSELLKFLRYRYELSERALVHHAKLAADAMVGKLLEMWSDALWLSIAAKEHPKVVISNSSDIDKAREQLATKDASAVAKVDKQVTEFLERSFATRSDDGLIEAILDWVGEAVVVDRRKAAIATLCRDIQNRTLFKPIGRCSSARHKAKVFERFGSPEGRRRLEEAAARYAGLARRWHVVLWVPAPSMRLKAAEVLVDDGRAIASLKNLDKEGLDRGQEIYKSHEALWAVTVFAPSQVRDDEDKRSVLLAFLGEKMGITWDDPVDVPTLPTLAARKVTKILDLRHSEEARLLKIAESGIAARGGTDKFDDLVARVRLVAEAAPQGTKDGVSPTSEGGSTSSPRDDRKGSKNPQ